MPVYRTMISTEQLRQGAILGTIAHAIWVAHHPELAVEQSWDRNNFNIQDLQGTLGTVTFSPRGVVAAFFDAHSPRNPLRSGKNPELTSYLEGMPQDLWQIANDETLQYLLQEYHGADVPLITAAFWSEREQLVAAEPWLEVLRHGALLIQNQLSEPEAAILGLQRNYGLSSDRVELLRSLFSRKMASPDKTIVLNPQERSVIATEEVTGLEESRELLAAVGIVVPP